MASSISEVVSGSEVLQKLLKVIVEGKDISVLLADGYTYWQLSSALKLASSLGYVTEAEQGLSLTDSGMRFLRSAPSAIVGPFRPRPEDRIEKLSVYDPYLPSWRTLLSFKAD